MIDADCQSTIKDSDQSCQETPHHQAIEDQVRGPTKNIHSRSLHDCLSNCSLSATLNLCRAVAQLVISLLCS